MTGILRERFMALQKAKAYRNLSEIIGKSNVTIDITIKLVYYICNEESYNKDVKRLTRR